MTASGRTAAQGATGRPCAAPVALHGICRICAARANPGYSMCGSCRDVAVGLGRPPVPVTPLALVTGGTALYRALRQYKSGEPEVAARQRARLAGLLDRFAATRAGRIVLCDIDVSVVVPSRRGGRPPPHPLAALVAGAAALPPLADVLAPAGGELGHRSPAADGYRATVELSGRRVLLVDDVYTSGAHLQSAAVALADAGALEVRAVVLGRFVREEDTPVLTRARSRR